MGKRKLLGIPANRKKVFILLSIFLNLDGIVTGIVDGEGVLAAIGVTSDPAAATNNEGREGNATL